jgi:hypothetical protein
VVDPAVRGSAECQGRVGVTHPLDAWPAIVWVGLAQVGQVDVDGVGVNIDES